MYLRPQWEFAQANMMGGSAAPHLTSRTCVRRCEPLASRDCASFGREWLRRVCRRRHFEVLRLDPRCDSDDSAAVQGFRFSQTTDIVARSWSLSSPSDESHLNP